ncbi:MAG: hypothetical protein R3E97_05070 [Candidatus Eisenbacteria bacterium]
MPGILQTLGYDLPLYSSAIKLNTQFMHCLWFSMKLKEKISLPTVIQRLRDNRRIATTEKTSANQIYFRLTGSRLLRPHPLPRRSCR